jgi:hypothetical protein
MVKRAPRTNKAKAVLFTTSSRKTIPATKTNVAAMGKMMGKWLKSRWRWAWFIFVFVQFAILSE